MEGYNYAFPQANDLEKVVTIMSIGDQLLIKNKVQLAHVLGVLSRRQVDYYVSACIYLGFITPSREFTPYGLRVLSLPRSEKIVEIARRIISNPVFGTVYFLQRLAGTPLEKIEVVGIMKEHVDLTEVVYKRRAQTVMSWVEWINRVFPDY